jgi:putative transposase
VETLKQFKMEIGQTYHIFNHANGSENIFREEENYRYFLQQYKKHLAEVVDTFAYCLMPNHFHLLVRVKDDKELLKIPTFEKHSISENLPGFKNLEGLDLDNVFSKVVSQQFSNFFNSFTKAFNKKYNRKGSLFMKNFKRKAIESDEQWQETFLYIHLNPIKHGFVGDLMDWKWSSWHAYLQAEKPSILNRAEALVYFDHLKHITDCLKYKKDTIMDLNLE